MDDIQHNLGNTQFLRKSQTNQIKISVRLHQDPYQPSVVKLKGMHKEMFSFLCLKKESEFYRIRMKSFVQKISSRH